jgi:hypothetical protein
MPGLGFDVLKSVFATLGGPLAAPPVSLVVASILREAATR